LMSFIRSAGYGLVSEQKDENLFVSQHSRKPHPMFTIQ